MAVEVSSWASSETTTGNETASSNWWPRVLTQSAQPVAASADLRARASSFLLTLRSHFLSGTGGWALRPVTLLGDSVAILPAAMRWTRATPRPLPQVLTECLMPAPGAGP